MDPAARQESIKQALSLLLKARLCHKVNRGALAEQIVGQLLRLLSPFYVEPTLHYWSRELPKNNNG